MLVVVGLAVGLVIIRLAESALARVLFGVTTSDAMALVTASALLLLAALVACVPPALRAMRVDPVEGLRAEIRRMCPSPDENSYSRSCR